MSSKWCFIEDRDFETGHGWRDFPHEIRVVDGVDGPLHVFYEGQDIWKYPSESYAWLCPVAYFDEHGHMPGNVRTHHVEKDHPDFEGCDDMEGHFCFDMTPKEMREHLLGLGMAERKFNR